MQIWYLCGNCRLSKQWPFGQCDGNGGYDPVDAIVDAPAEEKQTYREEDAPDTAEVNIVPPPFSKISKKMEAPMLSMHNAAKTTLASEREVWYLLLNASGITSKKDS